MRKMLILTLMMAVTAVAAKGQEAAASKDAVAVKHEAAPARSKDGKKLFGTAAALRLASVSSPRISPDGMRVAYLVSKFEGGPDSGAEKSSEPWKSVTQLWVTPVAGPASTSRQFTRGKKSVGDPRWSPDGKILAFTMDAGDGDDSESQVWFLYADGGEAWQVTKHKSGVNGFEFSPDGKTLLLVATVPQSAEVEKRKKNKDDAIVVEHDLKMMQLWTWDIASGEEKQLTRDNFSVSDPHWSPDGARIVFTTNPTPLQDDGSLQTARVLNVATGKHSIIGKPAFATRSARWSRDGKFIAYLSGEGEEIYHVDLLVVGSEGGEPRKLTGGFELNPGEPVWAPDGKTIYFSTENRESEQVFAVDVATSTVRPLTGKPEVISLTEISANGKTATGTCANPSSRGEVFASDLAFTSITPLTDQNAWLREYSLGETEVVHWKSSADGEEIDGIVTKPVGFDGSRKVPFLLYPHGGPSGVSLLAFNILAQFLAANGYLVLEPNFRGSMGHGEKFARANQNDWGNGDFKDDMSGVQSMVDRGWADPGRMGALGWSYGGYITFWIDTQTDRFKAISPGAGLPDLVSMYAQSDIHRYMRLYFNEKAAWENIQEYWDHSPLKYVGNVKTPTMILHGQADTRVPNPQSEEFFRALVDRHVPVEYVVYPRENHGFHEPQHLVDRMQRYLVFFGKYLDNPPVTEPEEVLDRMRKDLPQ
jgi:dipeptidyl aminopeptidase/acylaminoacyl peptidase